MLTPKSHQHETTRQLKSNWWCSWPTLTSKSKCQPQTHHPSVGSAKCFGSSAWQQWTWGLWLCTWHLNVQAKEGQRKETATKVSSAAPNWGALQPLLIILSNWIPLFFIFKLSKEYRTTFTHMLYLFFFWDTMRREKQKLAPDFHVGHLILEAMDMQSQKAQLKNKIPQNPTNLKTFPTTQTDKIPLPPWEQP